MILSDEEIHQEMNSKRIIVSGWDGDLHVGPSSLDLHLDNKAIVIPKCQNLDQYRAFDIGEDMSQLHQIHNGWDSIRIYPGDFMLLSTVEKIKFPADIAGFVQGRSSIARAGIQVHAAGFIDPGFEGTITLEVTNMTDAPLNIPKNIRICQIVFARASERSSIPYGSKKDAKYQGQSGPVASKISEELL